MTLSIADASALIRPNVAVPARDVLFRRTDFLDWMRNQGRVVQNDGGAPVKWNLITTGNGTAELYTENQPLPVFGKRGYTQASLNVWYARSVAAVTGHVRDQIAKGGTYEDLLEGELADGTKALMFLAEQTLCGSAQDKGIASCVDSTDVYATIDPTVVTVWASSETAIGGSLSITNMQTFYQTMVDAPRGASVDAYLASPTQMTRYTNLSGPNQGAASVYRSADLPMNSGRPYDIGVMQPGAAFNGAPFVQMRNLANSELYSLDMTNGEFVIKVQRDITVEPLGKVNDNTEFQLSMAMALKIENRRVQGKLTGLT